MNRGQLIRIAHENPSLRKKLIPIIQSHDKVAKMMKEAGRGLPLSKIQRYAETGILILSDLNTLVPKTNEEMNN